MLRVAPKSPLFLVARGKGELGRKLPAEFPMSGCILYLVFFPLAKLGIFSAFHRNNSHIALTAKRNPGPHLRNIA